MKAPMKRRILVGGSALTLAGALAAALAVGTAGHDTTPRPAAQRGGAAAQAQRVADLSVSPSPSPNAQTGTGTDPSANPDPAQAGHGTLDNSTREQLNFKNTGTFTGLACADYGGPNGLCASPVQPGGNVGLQAFGVTPASAGLQVDFFVGDATHPLKNLHVAFDQQTHCFLFEGTADNPSVNEVTCDGF